MCVCCECVFVVVIAVVWSRCAASRVLCFVIGNVCVICVMLFVLFCVVVLCVVKMILSVRPVGVVFDAFVSYCLSVFVYVCVRCGCLLCFLFCFVDSV